MRKLFHFSLVLMYIQLKPLRDIQLDKSVTQHVCTYIHTYIQNFISFNRRKIEFCQTICKYFLVCSRITLSCLFIRMHLVIKQVTLTLEISKENIKAIPILLSTAGSFIAMQRVH